MANTEVETIGVKLTLDASGFTSGAEGATGALNAFSAAAEKAVSGAGQMRAMGGAQVAAGGSSVAGGKPSQMGAINVPLTVNAESLAALRAQIIRGIGSIPINVTMGKPIAAGANSAVSDGAKSALATGAKSVVASVAKSVVAAVSTPAIGTRTGAAHAVERAVLNNLPAKATGGAVQQGRPILVGERRPEVFIPSSHGTIHPDANAYRREEARLRRREAELAALEYQIQKRRDSLTTRHRGGGVHAAGGRTAYSSEGDVQRMTFLVNGEVMEFHGTPGDIMQEVRGLGTTDIKPYRRPSEVMGPRGIPSAARVFVVRPKRGKGGAVEISRLPGGGGHYADRTEGYYRAIQDTVSHYQDHSAPGGYVGIAPIGRGMAVQLHGPGGDIESWRILRNVKRAGFGALAYRATMANEGGTFPLYGGPQPPKGYSVGIATGTSHLVEEATNYRDFLKQFHAQRKSQIAAGNFPPFVGTWLHEGQIHIDPAAVLGRKREADMVARAKSQLAFFDLKRFDEIPTSTHKLRANAERIQKLIMSGLHREVGGPASRVFTVRDPLGLHMRPSAILAQTANKYPGADIRLRNLTSGIAPHERHGFENLTARSMWDWAFLGAKTGDQIEMMGEGAQASLALHQLARLGGSDQLTAIQKRRAVRRFRAARTNRASGGPASMDAFGLAGKEAELIHRFRGANLTQPYTQITPYINDRIDRIRAAAKEHWIGLDELSEGSPIYIGQAIGNATSVAPGDAKPASGLPPEVLRRWSTGSDYRYRLRATSGLTGIHNHPPGYKGVEDVWRASVPDIQTMFSGREKESWVVTPSYTQIMRNSPGYGRAPSQRDVVSAMAHGLADETGENVNKFLSQGQLAYTPRFIRDFSSPEVLGNFDLQRAMFDRAAGEFGFNWELYKHPPVGRWQQSRRNVPASGQMGFGMAKGGRVFSLKSQNAYNITHGHGNIKGWQNEMWRQQEAAEMADKLEVSQREEGLANEMWGLRAGKHAKTGAVVGRMSPGELDFVGNLRSAAAQITPDQLKFGKVWYSDAQKWINEQAARYGIDPTTARGVTAALSAGTEWGANKSKAHRIFQTHGMGLFEESFPYSTVAASRSGTGFGETIPGGRGLDAHIKAKAIMGGADPWAVLGHTPKVGQFYRNLGGDLDAVTLDRWAYRTATRGHLSQYGRGPLRKGIDAAYRQVAGELGLNPVELQAATWLYERETNPFAKKGKPKSIGQLENLFSPMLEKGTKRAMGGIVSPGRGFASQIMQTASDWAADPFMAIMAWQQQQQQQQAGHKAEGGKVGRGDWGVSRAGYKGPMTDFGAGGFYLGGKYAGSPIVPMQHRIARDFIGAPVGKDILGEGIRYNLDRYADDPSVTKLWGRVLDPLRKGKEPLKSQLLWPMPGIANNYLRMEDVFSPFPKSALKKNAEGGPVLGPLQRRILGLKEEPRAEIQTPQTPYEPEWLRRAREAKLPPKIYRADGGKVSHLFTVADQLGLHMRPSAHLARMAADYDAFVTVENLTRGMPQRGVAEAKYMQHWLALAARQGNQLRISATGTDAEAAVRSLGGLIESPGLTRIASANRSLEKVDPQRMRAAEIFAKFTGRARGGVALERKALGIYGATDDIGEAGYLTPSGRLLDFSGRHYATGYSREGDRFRPNSNRFDYLRGQRNVDHREIGDLISEGGWSGIQKLMKSGFIRLTTNGYPSQFGAEVWRQPTEAQMRVLGKFGPSAQYLALDAVNGNEGGISFQSELGGREYGKFVKALHGVFRAPGRAAGGDSPKGLYIVGEIGKELFVPNRLTGLIPKKVMDQIPKAQGGMQVIGEKPNSLFAPSEDGIIVPNRLMNLVPHAARGVIGPNPAGAGDIDPMWSNPRDAVERLVANLSTPQFVPAPQLGAGPTLAPQGRLNPIGPLPSIEMGAGVTRLDAAATEAAAALGKVAASSTAASMAQAKPGTSFEPRKSYNIPGREQTPMDAAEYRKLLAAGGEQAVSKELAAREKAAQEGKPGAGNLAKIDRAAWEKYRTDKREGELPESPMRQRMEALHVERAGQTATMRGQSPRMAMAQLSSWFFGGRKEFTKEQAKLAVASAHFAEVDRTTTPLIQMHTNRLEELRHGEKGAALSEEERSAEIAKSTKVIHDETAKQTEAVLELDHAQKRSGPTNAGILRNLGVIIGATTAYGMAMQAASTVITDAAIPAAGKFIDQLTGFKSTATATTTALGQATSESHGNIQATLAQAGVTAGLSKDMLAFVSTSLTASVSAKAGQKAQQATSDLFRAAVGQQGAPQGLYGGYGGVMGSALLGEQMGGGKGFMETVEGQFGSYSKAETGGAAGGNPIDKAITGGKYLTSPNAQKYLDYKAKAAGMATPGDVGASVVIGGAAGALTGAALGSWVPIIGTVIGAIGGAILGSVGAGNYASDYKMTPEQRAAQLPKFDPNIGMGEIDVNARTAGLNDLSSAADRAARNMETSGKKSMKVTWEVAKTWDEIDQAVAIATKAGDTYSANLAMQSNVVMKVNGQIVDSSKTAEGQIKEHQAAIEQTAAGKNVVDAGVWAQLNVRQLTAQKQGREAQQQLTMGLEIPYSVTKNLIAQPLVTPGLGFFPGSEKGRPSATAAGLKGPAAGFAQGALASSAEANTQLGAIAGRGLVQAVNQVAQYNPASLPDFVKLTVQSGLASAKIAELTKGMGKLNQESSSFNWANQIRIATRSLGDALGMLGKSGGTSLGKMERGMHLLDIQSTQLGLQLQQRSITTSLAQAQFQAPGQTGEERFFAQKEAIAKAGIQQEQLNISTKEFNLSKQIWIENANRSALDAQQAVTGMEKARYAEGATIAAQEGMAKQAQLIAATQGMIDAILGTAIGNWGDVLSTATQGIGQFTGTLKDGTDALRKVLGYAPIDTGGTKGQAFGGHTPQATGFLGSASRPTDVTFGEAGTETVAILRNPRAGSLGSSDSGSMGNMTININGPVVREEKDIAELARCVAAEVERSLARKGQMFGLRGAAV